MDVKERLRALVQSMIGHTKYYGSYPCTIMSQTGKKCDVRPDSTIIGTNFSGVKIWSGTPADDFTILPGTRAMLSFENGNPQAPYVSLWEDPNLVVLKLAGGTKPTARVGDKVIGTAGPYPVDATIIAGNSKVLT